VLESAFNSISGPTIEVDNLPDYLTQAQTGLRAEGAAADDGLPQAMARLEKHIITTRAKEARSMTELADLLKISRQALTYKVKKYGLDLGLG
jgi:arginine utilization regulatory protein